MSGCFAQLCCPAALPPFPHNLLGNRPAARAPNRSGDPSVPGQARPGDEPTRGGDAGPHRPTARAPHRSEGHSVPGQARPGEEPLPGGLAEYFAGAYLRGEPYQGSIYQKEVLGGKTPVLLHEETGIRVWRFALDLRGPETSGREGAVQILFHYTDEFAFTLITPPQKQDVELYASADLIKDSNFGCGLYAGSREPSQWRSQNEVLVNNYWPRIGEVPAGLEALRDYKGSRLDDSLQQLVADCCKLERWRPFKGRASFCVPILCNREAALNVQEQPIEGETRAGVNRYGEPEPSWRNVWVIPSREARQGSFVAAQEKVLRTLRRQVKWCERNEHRDTLASKNNLVTVLHARGRLEEAERCAREVLQVRESELGPDHPDTLAGKTKLAAVLFDRRRLEEAERCSREVLQVRVRTLRADHPDTLTSKSNLAVVLCDRGRLEEAERCSREVLQVRVRTRGADHPDTLTSKSNLAVVLCDRRRLEEAERCSREVLQVRECTLGANHPDTLTSKNNLVTVLWDRGWLVEAERCSREVLAARARTLGATHPDTLTSKSNLAVVLRARGSLEEARRCSREVLEVRERTLGADHPDTKRNSSTFSRARGRLEEAERCS